MLLIVFDFAICFLFFSGCATLPLTPTGVGPQAAAGIYHRVEKGQTLWRIARNYDIDLDDLAAANHIADTSSIEVGQMIFIPHARGQTKTLSSAGADDFIWPVRGRVICGFNQLSGEMINKGIDIQPDLNSDVIAARSGKVVFASQNFKRFGKTLIIDHQDGFLTVYSRNKEFCVKLGDMVRQGDLIARISSSGQERNASLHFEIRKGHTPKNPLFYLP